MPRTSSPTRRRPAGIRRRVGLWLLGLAAVGGLGAALLWATLPDVRPLLRRSPPTTAFIELRRREAEARGERLRLRWTWRRLPAVSRYLRHAVVHAEDARFWRHGGLDWDALEEAARKNWRESRIAVGGSTITQQLAKNLYLSPSRTPLRKLREILIARRLEAVLPKRRLLELYLNVAEWGEGVFGAEAAARTWFGRSASELSPAEAARLAVALPSPHRRTPEAVSPFLTARRVWLVRAMFRDGLIGQAELGQALVELGAAEPPAETAVFATDPVAARPEPAQSEPGEPPEVPEPVSPEAVGRADETERSRLPDAPRFTPDFRAGEEWDFWRE